MNTMSPPTVLRNTYIKTEAQFIDNIIKYIFIVEALCGVDRLNLTSSSSWLKTLVRSVAAVILIIVLVTMIGTFELHLTSQIVCFGQLMEHAGCIMFAVISRRHMEDFFKEMSKFDSTVCNDCVKVMKYEQIAFIFTVVFYTVATTTLFVMTIFSKVINHVLLYLYPTSLLHNLELFLFGYVIMSVHNRLSTLNTHTEKIFLEIHEKIVTMKINDSLESVMTLYKIISRSMQSLKGAIKWQLTLIMTCGFVITPFFSYGVTKLLLDDDGSEWSTVMALSSRLTLFVLAHFFPCVACARMQQQVRKLRTLLATLPCERDLDKRGRLLVREFLTLTEEHDLSLSLFGVLNIDGSIPLQFLSLALTYHIILLQFEKIIGY